MKTRIVVLGAGPGGYVAAIRASQLGMKVTVVEKESLGGICLNWGCIPTKALLKSAEVWNYIQNSNEYGFKVNKSNIDFNNVIERSRGVADNMSKGVDFLFNKNKINVVYGHGKLKDNNTIIVQGKNGTEILKAPDFYFAEDYHQQYLAKNPNGYCGRGGTGVELSQKDPG